MQLQDLSGIYSMRPNQVYFLENFGILLLAHPLALAPNFINKNFRLHIKLLIPIVVVVIVVIVLLEVADPLEVPTAGTDCCMQSFWHTGAHPAYQVRRNGVLPCLLNLLDEVGTGGGRRGACGAVEKSPD